MNFRLHAFEPYSRANGPGTRAVVWFQGCSLGCAGCFNPTTHDPTTGEICDTVELANRILVLGDAIQGVSISGGEPFQQPVALLDLLQRLAGQSLSRLVFSGYRVEEIREQPLGPAILEQLDVLIAGRYQAHDRVGVGLLGSANQTIHRLTDRYQMSDLAAVPPREIVLHADGTMSVSGIRPWRPK